MERNNQIYIGQINIGGNVNVNLGTNHGEPVAQNDVQRTQGQSITDEASAKTEKYPVLRLLYKFFGSIQNSIKNWFSRHSRTHKKIHQETIKEKKRKHVKKITKTTIETEIKAETNLGMAGNSATRSVAR